MIYIVITSFNEPKSTLKAINSILNQKIKEDYKIIVVDPFPEVWDFLRKEIKSENIEFFLDPGEGKSYALNLIIEKYYSKNKNNIFIFTDGDVYLGSNAIEEIKNAFEDENLGCVTGRPISIDSRDKKYGYWSHFLFSGIDRTRKKLSDEKKFLECSGYLFAIRNGVIKGFPIETSEDSIIPYLFWKKGYKIKYLPKATVFVKNPENWRDWLTQKIRNIKAHENLVKIASDIPRTKSFWNEVKYGWHFFFFFPKNINEYIWTIQIYIARLYLYYKAFSEINKKKSYSDGWRGEAITSSTRTLD